MSATHITGVDERVEIIVGTTLLTVFSDVVSFDVSPEYDDISYKPLGRSGTVRSQDFAGYTGSVTVVDSTPLIEAAVTQIEAAMVARIPLPVTVIHTRIHKLGPTVSHTYVDCKLTPSRQVQREQATQVTFAFTCGNLRLVS